MDKLISYTDEFTKFISGKKKSGKNIQTSDGVVAYITNTGIAKPYKSIDNLSNTNGCTTAIERIDSKFGDMGIPVGSLMAQGQSCGNETKYVQSMPPKTTFDWKFYIESNPDLNLTTEKQAYDHWKSAGIHKGLLPNSNMLTSMTNIGKIGYVDINTTLHSVPKESYSYIGEYNLFSDGNVSGSKMQDCTIPIPSIKYGDEIYIKFGEKFGNMNQESLLEFGRGKTNLFLRHPVGKDELHGVPIKYGDKITIAASNSLVQTKDCGWWGCKVAYVNPSTQLMTFGPGKETGGTNFVIIPPMGSSYTTGTEIKYNDPFSLSYTNTITATKLNSGDFLTVGQSMTSLNGKYVLTHQADGNICLSDNPVTKAIWCAMTNSSQPGALVMQTDGNLCYYNSSGRYLWGSQSNDKGVAPYYLIVQDDRNVCIYDANNKFIWATNTSIGNESTKYPPSWSKEDNTNYPGNDSYHLNKTPDECKAACAATPGCVGIASGITNGTPNNDCYLKTNMPTPYADNHWNSYKISTSKPPPTWKQITHMDYGGNDISYTIKSLDQCKASCAETSNCAGIVTDDSGHNQCWLKNSMTGDGTPQPDRMAYKMSRTNQDNNSSKWSEEEKGVGYWYNDIKSYVTSTENCKDICASTEGCAGISIDTRLNANPNCYLKNKMENKRADNGFSSYFLTPKSATADNPVTTNKIGFVESNKIRFDTISKNNNVFTFHSVTNDVYSTTCNLSALQNDCNEDKTCIGFIHSEKDNTWQKMTTDSTQDMYKISVTSPNIYLKTASVDMKDKSCKSGKAEFIDFNQFSNYEVGEDFVMNDNQCNVEMNSNIQNRQREYNNSNQTAAKQADEMIKKYPDMSSYAKQTKSIYNQMSSKTNEYKNVLKTIKTKNEQYNDTYNQQNNDLALLEDSNKMHAFAWGLSSIVVIAMVVMLKNRQT